MSRQPSLHCTSDSEGSTHNLKDVTDKSLIS